MSGDRSGRPPRQYPRQTPYPPPPSSSLGSPHIQPTGSTWSHPPSAPQTSSCPPPRQQAGIRCPPTPTSTQTAQQPGPPPSVLNIRNVANTCYAVSTMQVLHSLGLQHYLLQGSDTLSSNLTNLLLPLLSSSPASPQFDLRNLVMALNMCLPAHNQFALGRQQCAGEYMGSLLSSLNIAPFFTTFEEVTVCTLCGDTNRTNLPHHSSPLFMTLTIPHNPHPANVATMVQQTLAVPLFSFCPTSNCSSQSIISSQVHVTELHVSVYWLCRNVSEGMVQAKSLTQVQEPDPADWNGRVCVALLAHTGINPGGGHWIAFLRESNIWWRVDSDRVGLSVENPFLNQMTPHNAHGYTIDMLFFT